MTVQVMESTAAPAPNATPVAERVSDYEETSELVGLVNDAAELLRIKGEAGFDDFRLSGSRWRQEKTYIFILDGDGNMLVHPDPAMEGRNNIDLKDVAGKPIVRGLIGAATVSGKPTGWFHYQWPVPGGILPRWKSSYVRLVQTPSGSSYIVGSGIYNDRMERAFVVDAVTAAVAEFEKSPERASSLFHDPTGPFIAKDAYVFVIDTNGVELINGAFPIFEGRSLLDFKDTNGKQPIREMLSVVETHGSGWVDYMWPKPGESVPTQKSAYVLKARKGDTWVVLGCGVYLADAPRAAKNDKISAPELMRLVREAAALYERRGDEAFREFRMKGSNWFHDETYMFVRTIDGFAVFHAADPLLEGTYVGDDKDVLGRPFGKMLAEACATPSGEGWVHYMFPEPGNIFPTWKSTFVKRVTSRSGNVHIIGSGIYNMQMDRAFVEDIVNRAADLVAALGKGAFELLRDKKGPFVFMDTYVFVQSTDGTELVNPAQPSLEGRNLMDLRDLEGNLVVRDEIEAALKDSSAWLECYWFKPGDNKPARKQTYVRKVQSGADTYVVGSGVYME